MYKHGDKYFGQTTIPANNPKINKAAPIVLDSSREKQGSGPPLNAVPPAPSGIFLAPPGAI